MELVFIGKNLKILLKFYVVKNRNEGVEDTSYLVEGWRWAEGRGEVGFFIFCLFVAVCKVFE